ncbi:uncharacterized protein PG986_013707 [Apiospora aurea]|uniref:Uncharacterized protein n=1 Tax=Apiospora aurea TaxID=335848 RepID=A0ABR1PWD0_9PEZI
MGYLGADGVRLGGLAVDAILPREGTPTGDNIQFCAKVLYALQCLVVHIVAGVITIVDDDHYAAGLEQDSLEIDLSQSLGVDRSYYPPHAVGTSVRLQVSDLLPQKTRPWS